MQRELSLKSNFPPVLSLPSHTLPLRIVRNSRARRYLLRLERDFSVRLTIPRGGSFEEANAFLQRNLSWIERSAQRLAARPTLAREWNAGTEIYWRGELVRIEAAFVSENKAANALRFGSELVPLDDNSSADFRPLIEKHIWTLAARELPPLVFAMAQQRALIVRRVCIRDQRSRWGSCSRRAAISLNWRILQAPLFVRDYLIIHELMHLREMNHSARFWAHVAAACPEYKSADRWLSKHSHLLSRP